ncbi:alpha/beta fold hydrolase [Ktedonospora formicarum]|uniref:Alpha/beta hydrolase n=1 Tax=Ktedonospora formicarum TaxID=2778364 RepID=A0A8J3MTX4_9CHLR|nr:alpha/beta hydrolase [Ktedonospora formicarum]GHO44840.1 alpha/beta hydrolase [Ktedonospora formicarum]
MRKVISQDGTPIAFEQFGQGPALILVAGATATHIADASLASTLAPHFTVFIYDRRGRGESGDTQPYTVEREVEDIKALMNEAGGSSFLFGYSSGAVLALEAARLLPSQITKLALYEPPFIVDDSRPPIPVDYVSHLTKLVSSGHRSEAVAYFMTNAVGVPAEMLTQMRQSPIWSSMEEVAHTIAYDGAIMGDTISGNPSSLKKWASVTIPTLVMDGEASHPHLHQGARELANILPNARRRTLTGQGHGPANEILGPILQEFFIG